MRLERARCATARETGASEMRNRARDWSERGRRPWGSFLPILRAFGSRSLQSLNYCGREKKGTACSLACAVVSNSNSLSHSNQGIMSQDFYNPVKCHVTCKKKAFPSSLSNLFFSVNLSKHLGPLESKGTFLSLPMGRIQAKVYHGRVYYPS